MTEMITNGIKAFPQLDMDLPFAGSNFDEQRAELVGFRCVAAGSKSAQPRQFHSLARLC
jgi:hypothetical protein